ncbi:MAG: hypothetical protein ABIW46_08400, partial [Acidimicrobiales bacterium]
MAAHSARLALATLVRHGVRFVLIGGLSGRAHGSPTITNDTDVCYARDRPNLEALAEALVELGAHLRGVDDDVPFRLDALTLERGLNFTFETSAGALDIVGLPAGVAGYEELAANAVEMDLGVGTPVRVCALDDLIRMKRAAG